MLLNYIVKIIKSLYNIPKASINHFAIYHLHYKKKSQIIEFIYNPFLFWLLLKLLLLLDVLSNYIVKFAIHHLYYKNVLIGNLTQSFICVINSLYFLCNLRNLLVVFLLACNSGSKKKKPLRTSLYLIFCSFQLSFLSSTLSKYMVISKWQYNLALASFPLLADISSVKLTNKAFFGFFYITQTVKFLLNDHALLNK